MSPAVKAQAHFRTPTPLVWGGTHDTQSLRLGEWSSAVGFPVRAMATTMGGRLYVVNPDPSLAPGACIEAVSEDHGFGGLALCVSDVRGIGAPTIFFGTLYTHEDHYNAAGNPRYDLVSSLYVYDFDPTTGALQQRHKVVFDRDSATEPRLFGLCGIATANLRDDALGDGVEDELILTTLNGDLVVYDLWAAAGVVQVGAPIYWNVFDGSLGVSNSILVEGNSLYVAGSMGLRKFDFTP